MRERARSTAATGSASSVPPVTASAELVEDVVTGTRGRDETAFNSASSR